MVVYGQCSSCHHQMVTAITLCNQQLRHGRTWKEKVNQFRNNFDAIVLCLRI